jgi:hypothetical protein
MISKRFTIALIQRGRATGIDTARAKRFHEVPHIQSGPDIVGGIEFTTRAKRNAVFFDNVCSQRDIAGDDKVAVSHTFDNLVVSDVEALPYLEEFDVV